MLPIFHYALKPDGLLFQGPSETVGAFTDLFEPLDKRWRIYRRKDSPTAIRRLPDMPAQHRTRSAGGIDQSISVSLVAQTHLSTLIERSLLNRFAPVSIVVNDRGEIVFIHGRTGQYLEPSPGQPGVNIVDMAREGLQIELAAAIRECIAAGGEIVRDDIRVKTNGDYSQVNLTVTKLIEPEALCGLLLLTLRTSPSAPQHAPGRKKQTSNKAGQSDHIERLERELTTVNAELQSKVDELSQANNDMQNLLNSTDIATVFLDQNLNVKRFTDQATKMVMLRPTDVGRPITELTSNVNYGNLAASCHEVLKTLRPLEREVVTTDGLWYLMRIMLYRTTDNVIDGLVITFVDMKQLKDAKKAEASRAYFESVFETVREPLVVLDNKHRVVSANRCFYSSFRIRPSQVQGLCIWEIGDGAWDIPALRELLDDILPQNSSFDDFEVEHEFPKIGRRVFILNARRLEPDTVLPGMILLAFEDVTGK